MIRKFTFLISLNEHDAGIVLYSTPCASISNSLQTCSLKIRGFTKDLTRFLRAAFSAVVSVTRRRFHLCVYEALL